MKKNKIYTFFVACLLVGMLGVGCDDNMPDVKEIGVDSLLLSEELSGGIRLEEARTIDISGKVTLSPYNATDRAENFYSSNPEIATVSGKGIINGNSVGECEITIMVGGQSVSFPLTVFPIIPRPFKQIELSTDEKEMKLREEFNLAQLVFVLPIDTDSVNDVLYFNSSDESILSVTPTGMANALAPGTVTVTITSKYTDIVKELMVTVANFEEYSRTGWTMTASHALPIATDNPEKNSLNSALDGDQQTIFCLVKPGRNYGNGANFVEVPAGDALHFTIDMKEEKNVNYFRIIHRNTLESQLFLRWRGFEKILGSNDGQNFTVVAENVQVPEWSVASQQASPDIAIPTSQYRYLRFYAGPSNNWMDLSGGRTIQIMEIYLGIKY